MKQLRAPRHRFLPFLVGCLLLLTGCLGFQSDDPEIPERMPVQDPVVYSHNQDYSRISGVLFNLDARAPFYGIAFSHDLNAPHGGYFVLGSSEVLFPYIPGDRLTITGELRDLPFAAWQWGTAYEIHSIDYTDGFAPTNE